MPPLEARRCHPGVTQTHRDRRDRKRLHPAPDRLWGGFPQTIRDLPRSRPGTENRGVAASIPALATSVTTQSRPSDSPLAKRTSPTRARALRPTPLWATRNPPLRAHGRADQIHRRAGRSTWASPPARQRHPMWPRHQPRMRLTRRQKQKARPASAPCFPSSQSSTGMTNIDGPITPLSRPKNTVAHGPSRAVELASQQRSSCATCFPPHAGVGYAAGSEHEAPGTADSDPTPRRPRPSRRWVAAGDTATRLDASDRNPAGHGRCPYAKLGAPGDPIARGSPPGVAKSERKPRPHPGASGFGGRPAGDLEGRAARRRRGPWWFRL